MAYNALYRIGLQHARPDLRLVKQIERAAVHESTLILEAKCTDLAINGRPQNDVA
jgi:hypothetical protein